MYTSLSYPALLFDWLITLTLTIFDNIVLDKSAGSKSGLYVDFYAIEWSSGSHTWKRIGHVELGPGLKPKIQMSHYF